MYGRLGSYVSRGTDVQAQAIFAGRRPADEGERWGYEAEERWGTLNLSSGSIPIRSERGAYQDFYSQFAAAVAGQARFPVPAEQAVQTLAVLDAARISATEGRMVRLER